MVKAKKKVTGKKVVSKKKKNPSKSDRQPVKKVDLPKEFSLLDQTKKKMFEFLGIGEVKRIAVISDNDQDGITASVQMKKFLDSKNIENKIFFYDHYTKNLSMPVSDFVKFSPERTIFLDLSDGIVSDCLLQVGKYTAPFLVVDHHPSEVIRNNSFRCMVVKPWTFSKITPSKYPTSKLVCDLFYCADWICSIGVIGDFAFDEWNDFLVKVEKKYGFKRKQLNDLEETACCISSQYPEKINSFFDFLCNAKSPKDLLKSDYFALKKLFDQKLLALKERYYKEADCFEDVGLCLFTCDRRFSSKLSNVISAENPSKVIIIFEQPDGLMKGSIRRGDFKVNCGELAKIGIAGTPLGKGGGHIPAAGATFPKEYLEEFKKRVRMYLLENPPKAKLL